jgi:hypothetical protein
MIAKIKIQGIGAAKFIAHPAGEQAMKFWVAALRIDLAVISEI